MPRTKNPADLIVRTRARERVYFPHLTERMALKISMVTHYVARSHFQQWHKRMGGPDFASLTGFFTPLVHVDVESHDLRLDPSKPLHIRGQSILARILDAQGNIRNLAREGTYVVSRPDGEVTARARVVNVFTRYDPDPARRRVTELPPELGLGAVPSRVIEIPTVDDWIPSDRAPDLPDGEERAWHYGQTDPNRHVNGMEYLHVLEEHVATALAARGHDLSRLYVTRARLIYRKPCFRGERYTRAAWFRGEAPALITAAIRRSDDLPTATPAVATELTLSQHEPLARHAEA